MNVDSWWCKANPEGFGSLPAPQSSHVTIITLVFFCSFTKLNRPKSLPKFNVLYCTSSNPSLNFHGGNKYISRIKFNVLQLATFFHLSCAVSLVWEEEEGGGAVKKVTDGQVVKTGVSMTCMYCHHLKVMSVKPGWVEFGVYSTSVPSLT